MDAPLGDGARAIIGPSMTSGPKPRSASIGRSLAMACISAAGFCASARASGPAAEMVLDATERVAPEASVGCPTDTTAVMA